MTALVLLILWFALIEPRSQREAVPAYTVFGVSYEEHQELKLRVSILEARLEAERALTSILLTRVRAAEEAIALLQSVNRP